MTGAVLHGPGLAGKRTLMDTIAARGGTQVTVLSPREPPIGPHDLGRRTLARPDDEASSIITFQASAWDQSVWIPFIEEAQILVLVMDSLVSRIDENNKFIARAESMAVRPRMGCVILTKRDLPRIVSIDTLQECLLGTPFHEWPLFSTRIDQPATLLEVCDWIIGRVSSASR